MKNNERLKRWIINEIILTMSTLTDEEKQKFSSEIIFNTVLASANSMEESLDVLKCAVMDFEAINRYTNKRKIEKHPVAA